MQIPDTLNAVFQFRACVLVGRKSADESMPRTVFIPYTGNP